MIRVTNNIVRLKVETNNFKLKQELIFMFKGISFENPLTYLKKFLRIMDTMKYNGVTNDALDLGLFSFSLMNERLAWLYSL
ncbi:hypothetical protein CR513_38311, partial [Mucuna pruriens]